MIRNEINNYINKKCSDCCHFKKENMELYKLNLPNEIVNNIIKFNYDDDCNYCKVWRCNQNIFYSLCMINIRLKRNVEEDIITFVIVYRKDLPTLKDIKQVMRISEKKYEVLEHILWMLAYEDVEDVKEKINCILKEKNKCKKYNKEFKYFC